ncbi:MAG: GTP pyrophosphokinase, partial [Prevotella sp.]|nr:GTP pyrophosphokinase [Prevotella sp.]
GNHILDAKWDMHRTLYFDASIQIRGIDRIGMLNEVTRIISEQMNINIHKVILTCQDGIFEGTLDVRVHDRDDVKALIDSLKKVNNLQDVTQIM